MDDIADRAHVWEYDFFGVCDGCGVADSVKLSPALRLRLLASAQSLFILAKARLVPDGLVPDVTRLRRVLATRLLHSRQGFLCESGFYPYSLLSSPTARSTVQAIRRTPFARKCSSGDE